MGFDKERSTSVRRDAERDASAARNVINNYLIFSNGIRRGAKRRRARRVSGAQPADKNHMKMPRIFMEKIAGFEKRQMKFAEFFKNGDW